MFARTFDRGWTSVVLVAGLALAGCNGKKRGLVVLPPPGGTTSAASSSTQNGTFTARFEATDLAGTIRNSFTHGDRVRLGYALTNHTTQVQTLSFPSFLDREFRVVGSAGPVWTYSKRNPAPLVPRQIAILAGQTQHFDAEWDLTDDNGNSVAPGTYAIEAEIPVSPAAGLQIPKVTPISVSVQPAAAAGALSATFLARDTSGRPTTTFLVGDPIGLEISLSNGGTTPATLHFATSQTHDFRVLTPGGGELWRWSFGKAFTRAFTTKTLLPGQTETFREVWDGRDNQGVQVQGGAYRIEGILTVTQLMGPVTLPTIQPIPVTISGQVTQQGDFASRVQVTDASGRALTSMTAGQQVTLELILTNTTSSVQTLFFTSSKMFDFVVHDASFREVWRHSRGQSGGPAFIIRAVGPGAALRLRASWDGTDSAGLPLSAGTFQLSGEIFPSALGSASVAPAAPLAVSISGAGGVSSGAFRLMLSMKDAAGRPLSSMRVGDTVNFSLSVTNLSGQAHNLSFPTGKQFDFVVRDAAGEVWRFSQGRFFTQAFTSMGFAPGQTREIGTLWDGRDNGGLPVRAGLYTLSEEYFTSQPLVGSAGSLSFIAQ